MEEIKIIKQQDVSNEEKIEICQIKSVFGNYSLDSQLKWIETNIKEDDIHFMLYINNILVAYLNLIYITILIDNQLINVFGIGNVCSKSEGKGYGAAIMNKLNFFLKEDNKTGILFCKESLIDFYKRFNWLLMDVDKVILSFNKDNVYAMVFNYNKSISSLEYLGKSF